MTLTTSCHLEVVPPTKNYVTLEEIILNMLSINLEATRLSAFLKDTHSNDHNKNVLTCDACLPHQTAESFLTFSLRCENRQGKNFEESNPPNSHFGNSRITCPWLSTDYLTLHGSCSVFVSPKFSTLSANEVHATIQFVDYSSAVDLIKSIRIFI